MCAAARGRHRRRLLGGRRHVHGRQTAPGRVRRLLDSMPAGMQADAEAAVIPDGGGEPHPPAIVPTPG